jgi:hypothetical protein
MMLLHSFLMEEQILTQKTQLAWSAWLENRESSQLKDQLDGQLSNSSNYDYIRPEVLVTLTQDLGTLLTAIAGVKIHGNCNFQAAIQVAQVSSSLCLCISRIRHNFIPLFCRFSYA